MEPITRSTNGFCQGAWGVIACRIRIVSTHRVKTSP
jgi:hypothetical protein